ncbi:cytochrome c peroxidase [Bradyrhizobium sp. USDA 4011]
MSFRVLAGIAVAVAATCTAIPLLLARDGAGPLSPATLAEIARVEAEIDRIEGDTLTRLTAVPDNQVQQIELLGKLLLFDKQLSVNRNEAWPSAIRRRPDSLTDLGDQPDHGLLSRLGPHPLQRTQATDPHLRPLAPVLHYNEGQGDLVGGNFWDMRATGRRLGNPAAEQAEGPPTNPVELGLPDIACAVYRVSQRPYRSLFEAVWGAQAFAIDWPADVETVCSTPGPPTAVDPLPVHLGNVDRGRAATTFDQMAQSIAGYEASHEVTAFSSKYDAVQAGKATFTSLEQQGYEVFRGKGRCNECHRDGGPGEDPLFTDFTASNIGTPANPELPYYAENTPDDRGYVASKDGAAFVDGGVGAFLANGHPLSQPSAVDARWKPLAPQTRGRFQVPTLRNVDKRPSPDFVKAYGHNGYFKRLKEIVRFYNTRDVLPRCAVHDPREGTGCWPAPESPDNMNTSKTGHLGLTDQEENALVAFMQALTDGYTPPKN